MLEITRHQHLHAVAVEADQLPQERDRQQALAFLVLLLEDDLRQHRAGDVFAALGVIDDEILAEFHHGGEVFERDVGAGTGVVESPVGVFFDCDRLFCVCHLVAFPCPGRKHSQFQVSRAIVLLLRGRNSMLRNMKRKAAKSTAFRPLLPRRLIDSTGRSLKDAAVPKA